MTQAVGIEQARSFGDRGECLEEEAPGTADGQVTIALAKGVVEEAGQDVLFLAQAAETLEEALLRRTMDDEVGPGNQQLGGNLDRLCVRYHPLGSFVEAEQDVHRDRLGDQRVAVVGGDPLRVVTEEACLDIAVDEEIAAPQAHQFQPAAGERHVELDLERRRSQHQCAHLRRVVVGPGGNQHRADALRHHRHPLFGDTVDGLDMVDEGLYVAHAGGEARAVAAGAWREAVATGVPGEEVVFRQVEFVDQVGDPPGVLMAAVEQQHRLARAVRRRAAGRPVAVEEFYPVVGGETQFLYVAHVMSLCRCPGREPGGVASCGRPPPWCSPIPAQACSSRPRRLAASSARPWRTRLPMVSSSRAAISNISQSIQASGNRPLATPAPITPKHSARSLLPIGPS